MTNAESLAKVSKDLMLKEPYYGFFLIMLNKLCNDTKHIGQSDVELRDNDAF